MAGKFVKYNCLKVLSRFSSALVTMFGTRLTPVDNIFITSSSSFHSNRSSSSSILDCNRYPDGFVSMGLVVRPDDDEAFCCSYFGIQY